MALRSLERYGMRLDELNRIRVVDEETDQHANNLKEHCNEFIRDTTEFQRIADGFISIFDHVSSAVEREKMSSIGARNLLQTYAKHREAQTQQLMALIREKQQQSDRLQNQLHSLYKLEANQNDFIEQFILQK